MTQTFIKTLQFKVRNPKSTFLEECAFEVNQVWNYANATSSKAIRKFVGSSKYLSYQDLQKLTAGCTCSKTNPEGFTHINSAVVQLVCQEYARRRIQFKKPKLRWRASQGSRKALGWIPFKQENISVYLKEREEHRFQSGYKLISEFNSELNSEISLDQASEDITLEQLDLEQTKGARLAGKGYDSSKLANLDFSHLSSNPSHKKGEETPQLYCTILGEVFQIFNEQYLKYHLVDLKGLVKSGNLAQDSVGDWYLNLAVELDLSLYQIEYLQKHKKILPVAPHESVGADPNSKKNSYVALSNGEKIESSGFYRQSEEKLGKAQRNGHKKQAKRLNRKIKRQRANEIHLISSQIVRSFQVIKIGDLKVQSLVKRKKKKKVTISQPQNLQSSKEGNQPSKKVKNKQKYVGPRMGKSLLDNGIGLLRTQLSYKSHWAGRSFHVVSEKNTTQACSTCGQLTGPKGLRELDVRVWTCRECGTTHDRDINSGKNVERVPPGGTLPLPVSQKSNSRLGLGVFRNDSNA